MPPEPRHTRCRTRRGPPAGRPTDGPRRHPNAKRSAPDPRARPRPGGGRPRTGSGGRPRPPGRPASARWPLLPATRPPGNTAALQGGANRPVPARAGRAAGAHPCLRCGWEWARSGPLLPASPPRASFWRVLGSPPPPAGDGRGTPLDPRTPPPGPAPARSRRGTPDAGAGSAGFPRLHKPWPGPEGPSPRGRWAPSTGGHPGRRGLPREEAGLRIAPPRSPQVPGPGPLPPGPRRLRPAPARSDAGRSTGSGPSSDAPWPDPG